MAVNEVSAKRRRADIDKLIELQTRIPRALEILSVIGDPARSIRLRINVPTAINRHYPTEIQKITDVEITLPDNYPFPPGPTVIFKTPIWNTNVYTSGKWCYGEWKITENLELFVIRLIKVIALDPTIINPKSAANSDAAHWYIMKLAENPKLFPTIQFASLFELPPKLKMAWNNIS